MDNKTFFTYNFFVAFIFLSITGCSSNQILTPTATPDPASFPTEIPTLMPTPTLSVTSTLIPPTYIMNLGLNIDNYDPQTGKAGDIIFSASDSKPFIEFGPGTLTDNDGNPKDNPCFEYHLDPNADVIAIADGTVMYYEFQEDTNDYEIGVEAPNNTFIVFYDHIKNPTIQGERETVIAGDVLGNPGTWNSSIGRFEMQIKTVTEQGDKRFYCPFIFFHPDLVEEYDAKVVNLMQQWESFKNSSSQYDEANHIYPGCLSETLIP